MDWTKTIRLQFPSDLRGIESGCSMMCEQRSRKAYKSKSDQCKDDFSSHCDCLRMFRQTYHF